MSKASPMNQIAPWPLALEDLVAAVRYKARWTFGLSDIDRGQGSKGLTLVINIVTPDSYHPEQLRGVNHYFPVPPAAYDRRSWQRWLFDQILLVETHEAMEFFALKDVYSFKDDSLCEECEHSVHKHDGRTESCIGCLPGEHHRFVVKPENQVYTRPYAPSHGPGSDPYMIREVGTEQDTKTQYTGEVKA